MSLLNAVLQEADKASSAELKKRCDELVPKIEELTERMQILTFALKQIFVDSFVNFTPTKSLEQLNYKNRTYNIVSDYTTLLLEVENLRRNYGVNDEEFMKCCEKMNLAFKLNKDLCTVVEGKKLLEKANHDFDRCNYGEAMIGVAELQEKLKSLKFEEKLDEALKNLKSQSENQLALYTAQLSSEWEDIFKWSEKQSVHYLSYALSVQQSDPILIQKVLRTLYCTDRMHAELGLFSHFFIDKLLHNVIRHNCEIFTEDYLGAIIFNIKIDLNDPKKPTYQTIFNNLTAIFEFLQSTLGSQFECNRTFVEVFADSIRDKFFNKIIDDCIKNNLPACDSTYENYKNIASELDAFNKFLVDLKFVQAHKSPLDRYITDTECVLYDKKCTKLLSDARELLSQSFQHGTIAVGATPNADEESVLDVSEKESSWDLHGPLFFPKCMISENVKKVMTLIVDHLEESKKLPETYRNQLVLYIKDIAVMYQTVVPLKFKTVLETSPRDIGLFFNNCFYLAHGFLGPPWRMMLPNSMADQLLSILVESIQDLRLLGLEKLSLYLDNQKKIIVDAVENKDNPALEPWSAEGYDQFDSTVNDTMNLLKELREAWMAVLPPKMYEKCMSMLISSFCQSVLARMFAKSTPISEELVLMLAMRLEDTTNEIQSLFETPTQLDEKIDSWTKFTKLPLLLKAQILELAELWKEDKELSQNYTCEEMRQVVKLRFPDNKYRLKILKEIQ